MAALWLNLRRAVTSNNTAPATHASSRQKAICILAPKQAQIDSKMAKIGFARRKMVESKKNQVESFRIATQSWIASKDICSYLK